MPDPNKSIPNCSDIKAWEALYHSNSFIEIQHAAITALELDEDAILPKVYSTLARLRLLYDGYDESIRNESLSMGASNKLYSYLLKSQSPKGTFHEAFFDNVIESIIQMVGLLNEIKYEQPDLCQSAAAMVMDSLLFYSSHDRPISVLTAYEMLEKHAIVFLGFLDTNNLEHYYSAYRPHGKHRILGRDILRAMKKELKSRKSV